MTTQLPAPKARQGLIIALVSLVLGLISCSSSIYSARALDMNSDFMINNFGDLRNGRGWSQAPQIDWSIIIGGLFIGFAAIVIGMISIGLFIYKTVRGKDLSIAGIILASAGIILGSIGNIIILLLCVLWFFVAMFIAG